MKHSKSLTSAQFSSHTLQTPLTAPALDKEGVHLTLETSNLQDKEKENVKELIEKYPSFLLEFQTKIYQSAQNQVEIVQTSRNLSKK